MNIRSVGVIGAGTMGSGIAQTCAVAGMNVVMIDVAEAAVSQGLATIAASLARLVSKDKIPASDRDAAIGRIRGTTSYASLDGADLVIEAATENEALKLRIFKDIDDIASENAIVATNTSSISVTKLAAATKHPRRFIGIHFFNPVPVMSLVEIIRGLQTDDATTANAEAFVRMLGKTPITMRNSPGFVVNRVLCPMLNEAVFALQEGLGSPEAIDSAMKLGCNHPLGPLALADLIGLDVLVAVMEVLHRDFNDPKYRPALLLKEMVAAGYLGRKTGRGFFVYPAK